MVTLIEQSQIRNFTVPSGVWTPSGNWLISGNINLSGNITGQSGFFNNLSVNNLIITGAVISPYLSGFLGINTSGSGILHFSATPDIQSGNNVHFRAVFSTGNPANPIQAFSSQDSQAEWQYFLNAQWNAWPALGLTNAQAQSSIARLMFSPTGFITTNTYYVHSQTIYQGNVSGAYTNSLQFRVNTNGFTLVEVSVLTSLFENIDNRYVRKQIIGTDSVVSGSLVSGIPVIIQTFPSIPSTNRGTGTIIQTSGRLWMYDQVPGFSGYRPVSFVTGIQASTGGAVLSGANPLLIFSGQGNTVVSIVGNNIIAISGSGSAGGGSSAGGVSGFGVSGTTLFTGAFIASGQNGITTYLSNLGGNISGIIISGTSIAISEFDSDQLLIQTWNTIGY